MILYLPLNQECLKILNFLKHVLLLRIIKELKQLKGQAYAYRTYEGNEKRNHY